MITVNLKLLEQFGQRFSQLGWHQSVLFNSDDQFQGPKLMPNWTQGKELHQCPSCPETPVQDNDQEEMAYQTHFCRIGRARQVTKAGTGSSYSLSYPAMHVLIFPFSKVHCSCPVLCLPRQVKCFDCYTPVISHQAIKKQTRTLMSDIREIMVIVTLLSLTNSCHTKI